MRVERFSDQYPAAAEAYGVEVQQLMSRDAAQRQPVNRWLALDDGAAAGAVTSWERPDDRTFLWFGCPDPKFYLPLTEAVCRHLEKPVYVVSDSRDARKHQQLLAAGYQIELTSEIFAVPFDPVLDRLDRATVPSGFEIVSAADVPVEHLVALDNRLRQEVAGTEGWSGDVDSMRAELAESPPFDRDSYLVGLSPNGVMVGLVRIWRNEDGPRFGMVATLPEVRTTSLGPALIRTALTVASRWGHETFLTETSISNSHIHPRLKAVAAESLGFNHQMVFRVSSRSEVIS